MNFSKTSIMAMASLCGTLSAGVIAAPASQPAVHALDTRAIVHDYATARPMELPRSASRPSSDVGAAPRVSAQPGFAPGKAGTGQTRPERLFAAKGGNSQSVSPEQAGTSEHVFTTARAGVEQTKLRNAYPLSAAGKLFFKIGRASYICSASLIKPGVVVTAAHCVSEFGANTYYTDFEFIPAYSQGLAPFGKWHAVSVIAAPSYLDGTSPCTRSAPGVVCQDDVAVMVMETREGSYPGELTGYFGYSWDWEAYNSKYQALITQLGYPAASDSGAIMQRTDSQGYVDPTSANNTIIGSLQTGGSSGGPWLVNFGNPPTLSGTDFGSDAVYNTVVGVTSWGYTDSTVKEQGAAPFLSTNIVELVNAACTSVPAAC
jgi:V8-like Glu-specific endopeptidase